MNHFYERINIADITDDELLTHDLNSVRCYKLIGDDAFMKSTDHCDEFFRNIHAFLNGLDVSLVCTFVMKRINQKMPIIERAKRYLSDDSTIQELLFDESNRALEKGSMNTDIYMFVQKSKKKRKSFLSDYAFSGLFEKDALELDQERQKLDEFEAQLTSLSQVTFERMNKNDVYRYCYQSLNLAPPTSVEGDYFFKDCSLREQLVKSFIDHQANYIQVGSHMIGSLSMDWLPVNANGRLMHDLYYKNPNANTVIVTIEKASQDILNELQSKKSLYQTFSLSDQSDNTETITHSSRTNDLQIAQDQLNEGTETLFVYSFKCLCYSDSVSELKRVMSFTKNLLNTLDHADFVTDDFCHLDHFVSQLPGHPYHSIEQWVLSSHLAVFLPLYQPYQGTPEYPQFLFKNHWDELIPLSIRYGEADLNANHSMVVAPTGSGKSFFINHLIKTMRITAPDDYVTVIDKGNSYKKICKVLNGDYYDIDFKPEYAMSPFPRKSDIFNDNEINKDQLIYIRQLVTLLIQDVNLKELSNAQERLIEKGILNVYKVSDDTTIPIITNFIECFKCVEVQDNEDQVFIKKAIKNLGIYSDPESPFSLLLNQPKQIELTNRFAVFEIGNLTKYPKLRNIYFFIIYNLVSLRMNDKERQQDIIYDEVEDILTDPNCASVVRRQYLGARKFGNRICCISQNIEHFTKEGLEDIPANADIKYILKLKPESIQCLVDLGFNENEVAYIENNLQARRDIFIKYGDHSVVAKLEPSDLEKELYSTDFKTFQKYETLYSEKEIENPLEVIQKKIPQKTLPTIVKTKAFSL
jgi:hypothetical protein